MEPESFPDERSREVIRVVLVSHRIPDHVHQTGSWSVGSEKKGDGSQSFKVDRGSLREDLIESSEMRSRGSDAGETSIEKVERKRMKKKKMMEGEGFMASAQYAVQ